MKDLAVTLREALGINPSDFTRISNADLEDLYSIREWRAAA